jgi:hypothetical protein
MEHAGDVPFLDPLQVLLREQMTDPVCNAATLLQKHFRDQSTQMRQIAMPSFNSEALTGIASLKRAPAGIVVPKTEMARLADSWRGANVAFQNEIARHLKRWQESEVGRLQHTLGGFGAELTRLKQWAAFGTATFHDCNIAYDDGSVSSAFVVRLGRMNPARRRTALRRHMKQVTTGSRFAARSRELFESVPELRKRRNMLNSALDRHCKGDYDGAFVALWPIFEGVFSDLLRVRREVCYYRGKFYRRCSVTGKRWRNGKGKPHELTGFVAKRQQCDPSDCTLLKNAIDVFLVPTLSRRNPTVHGSWSSPGSSSRSTEIIWDTYLLAHVLASAIRLPGVQESPLVRLR